MVDATGETQEEIGLDPEEGEATTPPTDDSPAPTAEDQSGDETSGDSEKPWKNREERDAYFAGRSSRDAEIDELRDNISDLTNNVSRMMGYLEGQRANGQTAGKPDDPSGELSEEELNALWQRNPTMAAEYVADRKLTREREKLREEQKRDSIFTHAKGRLLNRYPEFDDDRDPFSVAVDKQYQRECRDLGYVPKEGSMEWLTTLKAAAAEVERTNPNLRKGNRPSTRDRAREATRQIMDDRGVSNIPVSRSASRTDDDSDAKFWSEQDVKECKAAGLVDEDGKVPERVKRNIIASRRKIAMGRHPDFLRDPALD